MSWRVREEVREEVREGLGEGLGEGPGRGPEGGVPREGSGAINVGFLLVLNRFSRKTL